jgi:hypothetical protein
MLLGSVGAHSIEIPHPVSQVNTQLQHGDNSRIDTKGNALKAIPAAPAQKASDDDSMVRYTFWLMVFTGLLSVSTILLWTTTFRAAKDTRIAADAAKKSAEISERALIDLEGAFLYPVIESDSIDESFKGFSFYDHTNSQTCPVTPEITFKIKNYGRSFALPQNISGIFFYGESEDARHDASAGFFPDLLIGAGDTSDVEFTRRMIQTINKEDYLAIMKGAVRIYLRGNIIFSDIFGNQYEQTYCLTWGPVTKKFIAWGPTRNERKRVVHNQVVEV